MADIIFFDLETTSLGEAQAAGVEWQPHVIEYCFARHYDGRTECITDFVKPPMPVTSEVTKITSITPEMVADALPFAAHYMKIVNFIRGADTLCAHNLEFDFATLIAELQRIGKEYQFPWPERHYCTWKHAQDLPESVRPANLKLGTLYEHATGNQLERAHRADADVKALIEVYEWITDQEA